MLFKRFVITGEGLLASNSSFISKSFLPRKWSRTIITTPAQKALKSGEEFWDKNKRLNRPLSPHLTIYKPQVTSMLSVTHRGTGIALSTALTGFSIGMLVLPGSFPHYLGVIEAMHFGSFLIFLTKFALAFTFNFHVLNGLRHLSWDVGYGFSLRTLYKSGYAVLGTSLALAAVMAIM